VELDACDESADGLSKSQDWEVHMMEHQLGAYTDCAHGMGLAAISLPYYRLIYKDGLDKFVRFATQVWNVEETGKTKEQTALAGIDAMGGIYERMRDCNQFERTRSNRRDAAADCQFHVHLGKRL
jgi:alcohol dehydrogenase YqhD (iron-dependent ADH family)